MLIRQTDVDADYFTTLRIPIVQDVPIARTDDEHGAKVAVINQTLAKALWLDGSAIGRTFTADGNRFTVVGIARNAKYKSLTEPAERFAYFSMAQRWDPNETLLVRATIAPDQLTNAIADAMRSIDPGLPRPVMTTLKQANAIVLLLAAGRLG